MISREKSIPVFAASTPMSVKIASSSARMNSGGASCTAATSTVFWAVKATIALVPWQPSRANAFRSAWIPAPPPESEVAIVRQRGTKGTRGYHRPMATTAALWEELLAAEEVAYTTVVPPKERRLAAIPPDLHPRLTEALRARGVDQLYEHQVEALEAARRGEHVIVSTGTASGKTLAFNLPVLDALAADPKQRTLYLYPTKALAQDQARSLAQFKLPRLRAAIYDGDTPSEQRWQIRKWANLILTNPDMLNIGLLPHHDRWGDVLQNLRYVVVDEAHVYRGVFGAHVANVLRRLRRAAAIYGADPQFLLASATIANPGELAHSLLGVETTVIGDDAAPRAERTVAFWNPPLEDEELGLRASPLGEPSRLMGDLVGRGLRTICFAKSRRAAELIHRFTVERLGDAEEASRLAPYRAGYTPQQRREIERRLVGGELLGVTATDALELGIDIGLLDCAIS